MQAEKEPLVYLRQNPFFLNGLRVDPSALLVSSAQGETSLEPKIMELLVALSSRPGELWRREELLDALWPPGQGSDEGLTRNISIIRKILSEGHGINKVLVTVRKLGYRLDAKVSEAPSKSERRNAIVIDLATPNPAKPATGADQSWPIAIGMVVLLGAFLIGLTNLRTLTPATDPTAESVNANRRLDAIAVMPFQNLSTDERQSFLAEGIGRDLASLLGQIPSLRVIPLVTVESYNSVTMPVETLGRELDARFVVTGGVEKRGNRIRLRATLTDTRDGQLIWSQTYDEMVDTFYEVQDQIVQAVATSLSTELDVMRAESLASRGAFDLTAYEYVQLAEESHRFYSEEAANNVVMNLQRALEIQPENAIPHAYLAEQYSANLVSRFGTSSKQTLLGMSLELELAQSLAPNDPRVLRATGMVAVLNGEYDEALKSLRLSLARNPNDPHVQALYGYSLGITGNLDMGLELIEQAERRAPSHPRYPIWAAYRAGIYQLANRHQKAVEVYEESIRRNPGFHLVYFSGAYSYARLNNKAKMEDLIRRGLQIAPGYTPAEYRDGLSRHGYSLMFNYPAWDVFEASWKRYLSR